MNKFTLDEDAKKDWYQIVKHHRKKQKGLPSLSTLKTDVGNLETGLGIFNKGNSPVEGPTNNPISGPFGGDVSSVDASGSEGVGCCESVNGDKEGISDMNKHSIYNGIVTLEYENIPVFMTNQNHKTFVDWELYVGEEDVFDFLADLPAVRRSLGAVSSSEINFLELVNKNFNHLVDKYINDIREYFYDSAVIEAQNHYNVLSSQTSDNKKEDELLSDDEFDLSLRSII